MKKENAFAKYLSETGISDTTAAADLGVPPSTVMRWRRGEYLPKVRAALAIYEWTGHKVKLTDWNHKNGK